ncbi:hypothetical protein GCM10023323_18620 [Streptomyces thinghirensis]|uniref:Secreted protein n=1 Tax=Streptomyces thinghirensis TaxID=551547 RepID=A0ABP9SYG1_9ACTN
MRRRWAAAAVLLAWALLHLAAPRPPGPAEPGPDRDTAGVSAAAAVTVTVEEAGAPGPCEENPVLRHVAVRSPRTGEAVGADDGAAACAPAAARDTWPGGTDPRPTGPVGGPQAGGGARGAPELQTFRC